MGSNAVIDVVIGLVLMYSVMSVFCTVLNELISTLLGWRAKSLAIGIGELLDDPTLRTDFYNHGLIDGAKCVSTGGSKERAKGHPSYFSGKIFAMALLGSLDPTRSLPGFADVENSVKCLPDSNIRDVLLAHMVAADKDLTQLRDGVAVWFDTAMDRLGGVYKRKLKYISFGIGLALATVINADTIAVGQALWHDGALREQMVKIADHAAAAGSPLVAASEGETKLATSVDAIRTAEQDLRPMPIGWNFTRQPEFGLKGSILKLAGLILTALALTLGAPFWFDLLSKFVRLRGTGEKPERTEVS